MNNGTYMAIYRNKIKEKPERYIWIISGHLWSWQALYLPHFTAHFRRLRRQRLTRQRGGNTLYYHDGSDVFLGWTDENRWKTGIIAGLSRRLAPVLHFLFPDIPKDHPANKYIATNMIANIFGLGWAATPAGLKAMEALAELEKERGKKAFSDGTVKKGERTASSEMCDFWSSIFHPFRSYR